MLISEEKNKDFHLGIWKIEESKEKLLSLFSDKANIMDNIGIISSDSKILERLAVRLLFRTLVKDDVDIMYRENGRPYLKDSKLNISISHTKDYVAVILSPCKYVGLDIQHITDKVKRVRSKFISEKEFIDPKNELIHLLLHWASKETLYKAINKGVDLKNSFFLDHFTPQEKGLISVSETVTGLNRSFIVNYKTTPHYVLTYTLSD